LKSDPRHRVLDLLATIAIAACAMCVASCGSSGTSDTQPDGTATPAAKLSTSPNSETFGQLLGTLPPRSRIGVDVRSYVIRGGHIAAQTIARAALAEGAPPQLIPDEAAARWAGAGVVAVQVSLAQLAELEGTLLAPPPSGSTLKRGQIDAAPAGDQPKPLTATTTTADLATIGSTPGPRSFVDNAAPWAELARGPTLREPIVLALHDGRARFEPGTPRLLARCYAQIEPTPDGSTVVMRIDMLPQLLDLAGRRNDLLVIPDAASISPLSHGLNFDRLLATATIKPGYALVLMAIPPAADAFAAGAAPSGQSPAPGRVERASTRERDAATAALAAAQAPTPTQIQTVATLGQAIFTDTALRWASERRPGSTPSTAPTPTSINGLATVLILVPQFP